MPQTTIVEVEMSGDWVSVIIAVVGVGGTLASALITQRLSQQAKEQELHRLERLRLSEKEAADAQRKLDQLRACYIRLNANDRNYRDALLAYAYTLKAGRHSETESAEVAKARRAQRDARAEAQMTVSEEVLEAEGKVNNRLTAAHRQLKVLEHEDDANIRERLADETIDQLDAIIPLLSRARVLMRLDLGVVDNPPDWY